MRVLIIGHSRIVQKRVLPALQLLPSVATIELATRRPADLAILRQQSPKLKAIYPDYADAIRHSDADLVYVSTVNSDHAVWVEAALRANRHVVVDKPAFTHLADAQRLVALAQSKQLCLAESIVFRYHPQAVAAKQAFADADLRPTKATAVFSFPMFATDNFRLNGALGGGALFDLGPYALGAGKYAFDAHPIDIQCHVTDWHNGVDVAFSIMALYPEQRVLIGHFGFNTEYCNTLELLGAGMSVRFDKAFTTLPNADTQVQVRASNRASELTPERGDNFALFFADVIAHIQAGQQAILTQNLLDDATTLAWLMRSARGDRL
ncbi:MAG: Gfo/Idh/MocA family oxidoreductase [Anaerolineae bacterium]|nr:Gfo/Idh/MocA family oxidoreductase [Anaerolineae bacterium]